MGPGVSLMEEARPYPRVPGVATLERITRSLGGLQAPRALGATMKISRTRMEGLRR
jgi:hypothetical protein